MFLAITQQLAESLILGKLYSIYCTWIIRYGDFLVSSFLP